MSRQISFSSSLPPLSPHYFLPTSPHQLLSPSPPPSPSSDSFAYSSNEDNAGNGNSNIIPFFHNYDANLQNDKKINESQRRSYPPYVRESLENYFSIKQSPSVPELKSIAENPVLANYFYNDLNLSYQKVNKWFQNRRSKCIKYQTEQLLLHQHQHQQLQLQAESHQPRAIQRSCKRLKVTESPIDILPVSDYTNCTPPSYEASSEANSSFFTSSNLSLSRSATPEPLPYVPGSSSSPLLNSTWPLLAKEIGLPQASSPVAQSPFIFTSQPCYTGGRRFYSTLSVSYLNSIGRTMTADQWCALYQKLLLRGDINDDYIQSLIISCSNCFPFIADDLFRKWKTEENQHLRQLQKGHKYEHELLLFFLLKRVNSSQLQNEWKAILKREKIKTYETQSLLDQAELLYDRYIINYSYQINPYLQAQLRLDFGRTWLESLASVDMKCAHMKQNIEKTFNHFAKALEFFQ